MHSPDGPTTDNDNLTLLAPELFWIHALAGARFQGDEQSILQEVRCSLKNGVQEESIAKVARELRKDKGRGTVVRGHPSVSLLPLSSPTLPLSICTPYTHLCIISKDRTYSRRPPSLTGRRLPRSRLTDSRRLPASPPARTSTASDGLRTHRDRSA
jgi:hypothetical protein